MEWLRYSFVVFISESLHALTQEGRTGEPPMPVTSRPHYNWFLNCTKPTYVHDYILRTTLLRFMHYNYYTPKTSKPAYFVSTGYRSPKQSDWLHFLNVNTYLVMATSQEPWQRRTSARKDSRSFCCCCWVNISLLPLSPISLSPVAIQLSNFWALQWKLFQGYTNIEERFQNSQQRKWAIFDGETTYWKWSFCIPFLN